MYADKSARCCRDVEMDEGAVWWRLPHLSTGVQHAHHLGKLAEASNVSNGDVSPQCGVDPVPALLVSRQFTPSKPPRLCKLVPLMVHYNKCQQLTSTLTKSQTSGSSITAGQPSMYRASQLNSYVGSRGGQRVDPR